MPTNDEPTIATLMAVLRDLPPDAVWWAYEGEVGGLVVWDQRTGIEWVIHNDGEVTRRDLSGRAPS
jgi:hypothetical protein